MNHWSNVSYQYYKLLGLLYNFNYFGLKHLTLFNPII